MRIRATVAAVSGALALSALAVPAAQADDSAASYRADVAKIRQAALAASGRAAAEEGKPYALNVSFSNFKIAKTVKVGTTNHVSTTVTYTLTHGADVKITAADFVTDPIIYRGSATAPDNMLYGNKPAKCTATSATTADCKGTIDVYPGDHELVNADAGTWRAAAEATAFNGQDPQGETFDITKVGYKGQSGLGTTLMQRFSKLTVNASPEPVKKGKTITVTGKLSRANWEDNKYHGYVGQPVNLQFRKKNSNTYTTVKTIKTNSTGELKTTVKATQDGYFRYTFAGTTTTPAVNATGDFIDVQ
ncbi:lipoprotein [Streptomyces viridochromogenes]|uniref:Lipoprotein n=1 Tax=Streptomyces viridochromogenes TaxID=1938 RepID=A0A0J7ZFS3_STRVR|nr:hypothetical protein [Streptomyces viridochromogenes]KMS74719.1 lipoprotein [Streptomyces viridochromogenes]KOG14777.1 lipoprotein [Streptomyces viridochromogenes]KOG14971.1 lipoprotein [Streptomyces viridochromogenes]